MQHRTWLAKYQNPNTGKTNIYLLTTESPEFMDGIVFISTSDETKVLHPIDLEYTQAKATKVIYVFDANKGYDTLRRVYTGKII